MMCLRFFRLYPFQMLLTLCVFFLVFEWANVTPSNDINVERCTGVHPSNDRPIIGILAQSAKYRSIGKYGDLFLTSSYVKFLESGGARVVPILTNQTKAYYHDLLSSINGVLLPGGGQLDLLNCGYGNAAKIIYDFALERNSQGDYFPLLGVCFGAEVMLSLTAGRDVMDEISVKNKALPLSFTPGFGQSCLFNNNRTPPELVQILRTQNVTFNFHSKSLSLTNFTRSAKLKTFYHLISINIGENGEKFVSTLEAHKYPMYAIMWHPEKVAFQWSLKSESHVPHSSSALQVSQYIANFFVNEARKSKHHFENPDKEAASLIYKHPAVYTGNIYFAEQCYFFNLTKAR